MDSNNKLLFRVLSLPQEYAIQVDLEYLEDAKQILFIIK